MAHRTDVLGDCPGDRPGCVLVGQAPSNAIQIAVYEHGTDVFDGPLPESVAYTVTPASHGHALALGREYAATIAAIRSGRMSAAEGGLWWLAFVDRCCDELTEAFRCLAHDAEERKREGLPPPVS
jgi:hypothetical protein